MPRVKIKVERGNGLQQVVTVDTEATKGARLGRDVYMPDGTVATPASMRSWMGVSQGTAAPAAGPSLQSVLTHKGDLATRGSQVQRLGIGTQDQVLRVSSAGMPEWRSGAALTKTDDTNVTLTLGGNHATALLGAASIAVGWSGTLAQGRGGWGADISAANGYPKFTAGVAAFGSTVPWGDVSSTPTTLGGYGITDAYTDSEVDALLTAYTPTSGLAPVALSNDYGDLDNLPTLFDGDFDSLTNVPAILEEFIGLTNAAGVLTNDGSGNLSWAPAGGSGTVTSVGLSAPTGLSVSGSPVTTSGTLALSWAAGYQGYTTTEATKLSGIAPGATVGATWGTNLNSIPPIISTFAALANGSGVLTNDGSGNLSWSAGGGAAAWGSITGTLSNQTDLQSALDGKQASSSVLTAYAGGNTPSAFTLGIVDAVDAAAWRAAIGAGTSSLTIGGSNGQIQFNNSGSLDGSSGLTWNAGTATLTATNIAGSGAGLTNIPDGALSSNVALKNAANVFTQTQRIAYSGGGEQLRLSHDNALLSFYDSANSVRTGYLLMRAGNSSALWVEGNQALQIGTNNTQRMVISAAGNVVINQPNSGMGLTVLGGFTLSSGALILPIASIADAALSGNVPLKNASNTFTGATQVISASGANLLVTDGTVIGRFIADPGGVYVQARSNHRLYFTTNDVTRGWISSGGGWTILGGVTLSGLQNFANDAAAAAGGIAVNQLYRNGSVVMIRVS